MQSKKLTELIPYRRTVWMTGFLKTTLSASLISTGVVLLFNSITNHPLFDGYKEAGIIVGITCIVLAILIVTIIDKWKEQKKKEELEIIDKRAAEIAEEKILEAMKELEN